MRVPLFLLIAAVGFAGPAPDKPEKPHGPPGHARREGGLPPGLAKKGGLPPGLAKKFGKAPPPKPYVAFDPRRNDRAWFLIDGRWVLKTGLTGSLKLEIQQGLKLPPVPPPIPLPKIGVDLHVVLF